MEAPQVEALAEARDRLAEATAAVKDAARAMARAASGAEEVVRPFQQRQDLDYIKRLGDVDALAFDGRGLPLDGLAYLAIEYGKVGAQLEDWRISLDRTLAEPKSPEPPVTPIR